MCAGGVVGLGVFMYVCVHMYACTNVCIYVCLCANVCLFVCVYVHVNVCFGVCVCVCVCICMHVQMYVSMYVCVHMYVLLRVCIYVCMCMLMCVCVCVCVCVCRPGTIGFYHNCFGGLAHVSMRKAFDFVKAMRSTLFCRISSGSVDTNLITVTEKHSFPASDSPTLKSNCFFKIFVIKPFLFPESTSTPK